MRRLCFLQVGGAILSFGKMVVCFPVPEPLVQTVLENVLASAGRSPLLAVQWGLLEAGSFCQFSAWEAPVKFPGLGGGNGSTPTSVTPVGLASAGLSRRPDAWWGKQHS